jgi:hypothetical protein
VSHLSRAVNSSTRSLMLSESARRVMRRVSTGTPSSSTLTELPESCGSSTRLGSASRDYT